MPRYIDADALLEKLQVDFDKQGRKSDYMALRGESELSVKYNHGQYCYLNAMEQVKDTPTADVVPKSEADMLHHLLKDAWKRIEELDDLCGELQKADAEVAMEIFEEIDLILFDYTIILDGEIGFLSRFDELKKKYTEEQV